MPHLAAPLVLPTPPNTRRHAAHARHPQLSPRAFWTFAQVTLGEESSEAATLPPRHASEIRLQGLLIAWEYQCVTKRQLWNVCVFRTWEVMSPGTSSQWYRHADAQPSASVKVGFGLSFSVLAK